MIDQHAATELQLYIENDADLNRQQRTPIHKNLATKKVRSQYKHDLAVKLFGYLVEAGAKKYAKEFGEPPAWHRQFNVPTRKAVAEAFTREFEGEFELGNYDYLLPKKYQKEMMGVGGKSGFPTRHHNRKKPSSVRSGSGKAEWNVPESLVVKWSPVNQAYLALWPGRGRVEDQQVLKIGDAEDMHSWLRDTYGEAYGLRGRRAHSTRTRKTSPAQLDREIAEFTAAQARKGRR